MPYRRKEVLAHETLWHVGFSKQFCVMYTTAQYFREFQCMPEERLVSGEKMMGLRESFCYSFYNMRPPRQRYKEDVFDYNNDVL